MYIMKKVMTKCIRNTVLKNTHLFILSPSSLFVCLLNQGAKT